MRGALVRFDRKVDRFRWWIIPADAGSTSSFVRKVSCAGDHPRGCGEHIYRIMSVLLGQGSSPRMRGAPDRGQQSHICRRIIPADAGSTQSLCQYAHKHQDHPRGCGEHSVARSRLVHHPGSSPRMRGAHDCAPTGWPGQGIIPADAGSTWTGGCPRSRLGDHPRGCGEHSQTLQ